MTLRLIARKGCSGSGKNPSGTARLGSDSKHKPFFIYETGTIE